MRNPELFTTDGEAESLTNLYLSDNCSVMNIYDAIEDSSTGAELVKKMNALKLFSKFILDRETDEYVRLVTTDCFGKRHYFKVQK